MKSLRCLCKHTRIQGQGEDNIRTRLGIKAYARSEGTATDGKSPKYRPFIQTSWIHDSGSFGVKMDGTDSIVVGTRNVAELKVGLESRLSRDLNVWGNIGYQAGNNCFNDGQVGLGFSYNF
jgi:outer membrane autotransporter protein